MLRSLLWVGLIGICTAASAAEQIVGNTPLVPAPSTYTILALPANYESSTISMDLINGFDRNQDLLEVRQNSSFVAYEDGHPEFEDHWQGYIPEVSQGKPVLLVMDGNQVLYKRTNATSKQVSYELRQRGILKRLRERKDNRRPDQPNQPNGPLNCDPVNPTTPVNPIPDTPPLDEYPEEEESPNTGATVGILAALGAAVWAAVFAFRSQ